MFLYCLFLCAVMVDECEHNEWFEKLQELMTTPVSLSSQQIIIVGYVTQTIQEKNKISETGHSCTHGRIGQDILWNK